MNPLTRGLVIAAAFSLICSAKQVGEWEAVQTLQHGRKITVQRKDGGAKLRGKVSSVDLRAIVVETETGEVEISRENIRRVRVHPKPRRLWGRIVGTGVGAALGAPCARICDASRKARASAMLIPMGIGFVIGYGFDLVKLKTIYRRD